MGDLRVEKLAEMMVRYSVNIQPGERVGIRGSSVAEPLIVEIYKQVILAGGYPYMMVNLPRTQEIFYKYANQEQLTYIHQPVRTVYETYDALISVMADQNTRALSNVEPEKMVTVSQASRDLSRAFMQRSAKGELKWTLTLFPTNAHAQDADMSLGEYEDFVYSACMPDLNDPVGYWRNFSNRQARIIDWLKGKKNIHVIGKETDLTLSVDGRTFINCDCHNNVPDGEIFTGPVENSANGTVYFSYPAIYGGREVVGVRLWFENGKVVKATADKNEDFLQKTLDTDEGARFLGEFAIGTNEGITRFTHEILFDEKIGGSFHMAVGAGYPETGSVNDSAIHWDMICDLRDGGEIWADEELLYRNGKFVI